MTRDFNRRSFLGIAAGLSGAAVLAACGRSVPASAPAPGVAPAAGGEVTYLVERLVEGYQQQQTGSWHVAQVWNQVVERLFVYDAQGRFVPHLATGFTQNDERTRFTVTVRRGVTFSNGEKLDAHSVAANIAFLAKGDKDRGISRSAYFPKDFKSATALDDDTVEIVLGNPFGDFIQKLGAWTTLGILAPETINADLEDQSDLLKVYGTGPFVVESWVPGKEVVLRRRPDYSWTRADAGHTGPAYLDKITVQQVGEPSLRAGALQSNQVDIIHYVQPVEEAWIRDGGYQLVAPTFFGSVWGLQLRLTAPHLDDIRVRKALAHATNREEILKTNFPSGEWQDAKSIFNDIVPGTLDLRERYRYDLAEVDRLLNAAGWSERDSDGYRVKDGGRLSFHVYPSVYITTSQADLQLLSSQWQRAGIELELRSVDFANYPTVTGAEDVPLYENHWLAGSQTEAWRWWHSAEGNQFKAPSKELDGLLTDLVQAKNDAGRIRASGKVQEYVIDNAYYLPIHDFRQTWGATKALQGLNVDGLGIINFHDAWLAR